MGSVSKRLALTDNCHPDPYHGAEYPGVPMPLHEQVPHERFPDVKIPTGALGNFSLIIIITAVSAGVGDPHTILDKPSSRSEAAAHGSLLV